ncbi:hypothetical protein ACFVH0_06070 [Streptomyces sp. NPDC127117]|uniref:hypothetical protein n=1 Tax=Streptomyces sp. NPDC127117 TaxID=3345368 RepID=UPI003645965A
MTDHQQLKEQERAGDPRLTAWLDEQRAAFPEALGSSPYDLPRRWKFDGPSLDHLEQLVLRSFGSREDFEENKGTALVQVAAWYLGEVHNQLYGTQWQCAPEPGTDSGADDDSGACADTGACADADSGAPYVIIPYERIEDFPPPADGSDRDGRPRCSPLGELSALFTDGPGRHLRDTLDRYEEPDEPREEEEQEAREREYADNPRLAAWLDAQRAAFPEALCASGDASPGTWDFGASSLDHLEQLILRGFTTYEDFEENKGTASVQVAAWYLGEVHNRLHGTQWQCAPEPDSGAPYVIIPYERMDEYPPADDDPAQDGRPMCTPTGELSALFLRGPGNHLRDTLAPYSRGSAQ